jgi:DNA-binding MarR family transcriptional regulator
MAHRDRGPDGEESLAEAFWSVARRMRQASADSLARWDVTPSQSRALRVLAHHGTLRLSQLSQHLHIAARSVTEVADELEAKDLARRLPDPDDRRATLIALTEHGATVIKAIRQTRATDAERVFEPLTERERAELTRVLRKLRAEDAAE